MRTFSATLLAGIVTLISAQPITFSIFAAANNTQFWDLPINANNGGFWVNRRARQFCPEVAQGHCSSGTRTIIHGQSDKGGSISLGSMVPGGQDIYLTKEGELRYTKAHSNSIPEGAVRNPKGFTYEAPKGRYNDLGRLKYSAGGFALCGPEDPVMPAYQLFVDMGKLNSDCVPIEVGARANTGNEAVWQYD